MPILASMKLIADQTQHSMGRYFSRWNFVYNKVSYHLMKQKQKKSFQSDFVFRTCFRISHIHSKSLL